MWPHLPNHVSGGDSSDGGMEPASQAEQGHIQVLHGGLGLTQSNLSKFMFVKRSDFAQIYLLPVSKIEQWSRKKLAQNSTNTRPSPKPQTRLNLTKTISRISTTKKEETKA